MRARFKGPSGTGVVELGDDASVKDVLDEISSKTGIQNLSVKFGPPMAMSTIHSSDMNSSAKSLGLHGETLTVVPEEARPITPPKAISNVDQGQVAQTSASQRIQNASANKPEDICVPWPEREGTLCECAA